METLIISNNQDNISPVIKDNKNNGKCHDFKEKYYSIYTPTGGAREYAKYAMNIYHSCGHKCVYCFCPSLLKKEGIKGLERIEIHAEKFRYSGIFRQKNTIRILNRV